MGIDGGNLLKKSRDLWLKERDKNTNFFPKWLMLKK